MVSSGGIRSEWKTTANIITLVRIFLIPVFVVAILAPWPEWILEPGVPIQESEFVEYVVKPWVAALAYAVLAVTDGLDGYIARKRGEITTFGQFIDPIADKVLVAAALLALIELGDLPSWVVLIIIAREFVISGLRMVAASEGIVVAARMSGKVKTVLTMVAILMFIVKRSTVFTEFDRGFYAMFYLLSWCVMIAALVMTVVSMFQYISQVFGTLDGKAEGRGSDWPSLSGKAAKLLERAREKGVHIATAESCTGGLIGAVLTSVPGSSDSFEGGIVSYAYAAKESELGVSSESLKEHGAVSEQVALQMAEGAMDALLSGFDDRSRVAIAVTGVAGPAESESKPAGTVWFGICGRGPARAEQMRFEGDRDSIRRQAVEHAMEMVSSRMESSEETPDVPAALGKH